MDNATNISTVSQSSETTLAKTFLVGMATPFVRPAYRLVGKQAPRWITKEFRDLATRPLKNACFVFGLVTGVSAIAYTPVLITNYLMDESLASAKDSIQKSKTDRDTKTITARSEPQ